MRPGIRTSLYTLIGVIVFALGWANFRSSFTPEPGFRISLQVEAPEDTPFDLFYDTAGTGFSESFKVKGTRSGNEVTFRIGQGRALKGLRFDLGEAPGTVVLQRLRVEGNGRGSDLDAAGIERAFTPANDIAAATSGLTAEGWSVQCTGQDPFVVNKGPLPAMDRRAPAALAPFAQALLLALVVLFLFHVTMQLAGAVSAVPAFGKRPSRTATVLVLFGSLTAGLFAYLLVARILHAELPLVIRVEGTFPVADRSEVYYAPEPGAFAPMRRIAVEHTGGMAAQVLTFTLTGDSVVHFLRFDPGSAQHTIWIDGITVSVGDASQTWRAQELKRLLQGNHLVRSTELEGARLRCDLFGSDPFLLVADDLGPMIGRLRRRSGAGPFPLLSALLGALFFALGAGRRLAAWYDHQRPSGNDLAMAALFCVVISLPLLTAITGTDPQMRNTEKRKMLAPPDPSRVMDLPADLSRYYEENFSLRRTLFRWNSLLYLRVLGESSLPDRVITGKNGWMFQYNEQVLGNYRGVRQYTHAQLESIRLRYEARQQWLAALGIKYYILVPPLSGNLNREHLPDRFHRISDSSWIDEVKAHFDQYSTVPIIDPSRSLREAKREREVYFRTDIHWNPYGAYIGYKALMDRIHADDPRIAPPIALQELTFRNDTNQMADLSEMLAVADVYKRVEPVMTPVRPFKAAFSHVPDLPGSLFFLREPHQHAQADTTLPKLLMFHDSFGLYMEPLMSEHFSTSTYVWSGLFIPDVVEAVKPDIVVQEFMEMFVVNMPVDTLHLSHP